MFQKSSILYLSPLKLKNRDATVERQGWIHKYDRTLWRLAGAYEVIFIALILCCNFLACFLKSYNFFILCFKSRLSSKLVVIKFRFPLKFVYICMFSTSLPPSKYILAKVSTHVKAMCRILYRKLGTLICYGISTFCEHAGTVKRPYTYYAMLHNKSSSSIKELRLNRFYIMVSVELAISKFDCHKSLLLPLHPLRKKWSKYVL